MTTDQTEDEELKSGEFNEIAGTIFTPVYPILARIILEKSLYRSGVCLDLGCGPGHQKQKSHPFRNGLS